MTEVMNNESVEVLKLDEKKVVESDRLNIAVVGLGNAGSQSAYAAFCEGFPAIALNSSEKDMRSSVLKGDIPAIIVGDGRGAAKDRVTAKEFLKQNLNAVFTERSFTNIIEPADIVVLVSSVGGGTGAGWLALLANRIMVKYPAKTVICFGITPKLNEAGQAHMNKIEVIDELNKIKVPFTLLDLSTLEDLPNEKAFERIAMQFVEDLKIIRGDYSKLTTTGMIDAREWLTLFNNGGYFITVSVAGLTDRDVQKQSIQARLIENLEQHNVHAKINADKNIRYIGAVANFTESLEDAMKSGNLSELNSYLGRPVDMFTNYSNEGRVTEAYLVITGLTIPVETIDASKSILMEYSLVNKRNVDLSADREDVSFFGETNSRNRAKLLGKGESNITDISEDLPDFL